MEFEIKSRLDNLYNHNYLRRNDYQFLRPCGSKLVVMYGLWKVHKGAADSNNLSPFHPLLSAIGTCNYNLAKNFVPILKHFTINEYTIKDAFSSCNQILDQD